MALYTWIVNEQCTILFKNHCKYNKLINYHLVVSLHSILNVICSIYCNFLKINRNKETIHMHVGQGVGQQGVVTCIYIFLDPSLSPKMFKNYFLNPF